MSIFFGPFSCGTEPTMIKNDATYNTNAIRSNIVKTGADGVVRKNAVYTHMVFNTIIDSTVSRVLRTNAINDGRYKNKNKNKHDNTKLIILLPLLYTSEIVRYNQS